MWEGGVRICDTPGIPNNFPWHYIFLPFSMINSLNWNHLLVFLSKLSWKSLYFSMLLFLNAYWFVVNLFLLDISLKSFCLFLFLGDGGEGRQAISNEEQNPKGLCNTIYRWCASVHHIFFFLFLLSVYLSWLCSDSTIAWSLWQRHNQLQENQAN